jgi:hypothetical protein
MSFDQFPPFICIPGRPEYIAFQDGRIYSVPRSRTRGGFLKPIKNKSKVNTYLCVNFWGRFKRQYIHRLILMTFLGPPPSFAAGCHVDDNPENNHFSNLVWGSQADNELFKSGWGEGAWNPSIDDVPDTAGGDID